MFLLVAMNPVHSSKNLKVDGCPSKENLSGQSVLLMNATYIIFPQGNLEIHGIS